MNKSLIKSGWILYKRNVFLTKKGILRASSTVASKVENEDAAVAAAAAATGEAGFSAAVVAAAAAAAALVVVAVLLSLGLGRLGRVHGVRVQGAPVFKVFLAFFVEQKGQFGQRLSSGLGQEGKGENGAQNGGNGAHEESARKA